MDIKQHLLKRKRFFDEEIEQYKGPDPLKIRCEFFNWLENYSKEDIADIYFPLLEETLKLFMDHPAYKQDLRFIRLWLNYSATQPNPAEVMKNMHNRGLGTECPLLYSKWAEQLIKMGSFATADSVFKMGLTANIQTKSDLQKQYDDFLKDIGMRVIMGKLQCPKCGTAFQSAGDNSVGANINDNGACSSESVENWEWNPLKVGDKDDFECPIAYFEEDDPTKIRMYPKHKVYPGNGQEFSLEEIRAAEYELRYKEEEEREKMRAAEERERALAEERERALAEARAKEEEARKKEAEMFKPPVQATIPAFTPKMLSLPKRSRENNSPAAVVPKKFVGAGLISNWAQEMDSSLANSTTFTVHTKEAMNVVQDMWSSPAPAKINTRPLSKNENPTESTPIVPAKPQFEIYTEEEPTPVPPPQKTPFQIYDENVNSNQKKAPRKIMDAHDENAPPTQDLLMLQKQPAFKLKTPIEIYNDSQAMKTPNAKMNPGFPNVKNRIQLFKDDEADLAEKLESQATIHPPMFNVQDKNDDFSDITCNTKAFEFILPSSTPLHKTQKPPNTFLRNEEPPKLKEQTNLSVILEQSKDRSGNSSTSSVAPNNKSVKSGATLQSDENNSDEEESYFENFNPLEMQRPSSIYPIAFLSTIVEEDSCLLSNSSPSSKNVYNPVEQKISNNTYSIEVNMNVLDISITSPKRSLRKPLGKTLDLKIDKENVSPGMLGFPFSHLIERPNSAIPSRRSNQYKPLASLHDQENMPYANADDLLSELVERSDNSTFHNKVFPACNQSPDNKFHKQPLLDSKLNRPKLCSPGSGKCVSFKDENSIQTCLPNRSWEEKHRRNSDVLKKYETLKCQLENCNTELNEDEGIGLREINKDSLEIQEDRENAKCYLQMTRNAKMNKNAHHCNDANLSKCNFRTNHNSGTNNPILNNNDGTIRLSNRKGKKEHLKKINISKRWSSFSEITESNKTLGNNSNFDQKKNISLIKCNSLEDKNTAKYNNQESSSLKHIRHTIGCYFVSGEIYSHDSETMKIVKASNNKNNESLTIIPPARSDMNYSLKTADSKVLMNLQPCNAELNSSAKYFGLVNVDSQETSISVSKNNIENNLSEGDVMLQRCEDSQRIKKHSNNDKKQKVKIQDKKSIATNFPNENVSEKNKNPSKNSDVNVVSSNVKAINSIISADSSGKKCSRLHDNQNCGNRDKKNSDTNLLSNKNFERNKNYSKNTDISVNSSNIKAINSVINADSRKENINLHQKQKSRSTDWKMICSIPLPIFDKDFIEKKTEHHPEIRKNVDGKKISMNLDSSNLKSINRECISKNISVKKLKQKSKHRDKNGVHDIPPKNEVFTLPKTEIDHENIVKNISIRPESISENCYFDKNHTTRSKENSVNLPICSDAKINCNSNTSEIDRNIILLNAELYSTKIGSNTGNKNGNSENIDAPKEQKQLRKSKKKDKSLSHVKGTISTERLDTNSVKLEHTDFVRDKLGKLKRRKTHEIALSSQEVVRNIDRKSSSNILPNNQCVEQSINSVSNEFYLDGLKKRSIILNSKKSMHSPISSKFFGGIEEEQSVEKNNKEDSSILSEICGNQPINIRCNKYNDEANNLTSMSPCYVKNIDNWNHILRNIDTNSLQSRVTSKMSESNDNALLKEPPNTDLQEPKIENSNGPKKRRGRPTNGHKPTKVNNENNSPKKIIKDQALSISPSFAKSKKSNSTVAKMEMKSKQKNIENDDEKNNKTRVRRSTRILNRKIANEDLAHSPSLEDIKVVVKNSRKGRKHQAESHSLVPDTFDPFNGEIIEDLLKKVGFPKAQYLSNYNVKPTNLPTGTKTMKLGNESYNILGEIGKGAYAKVVKASNSFGNIMALKIEKPACKWEFYIAKEIQLRVPPKMAPAFMDISSAYIYNNGSILETQFAKYGTLINNINIFKEKAQKPLDLGVIIHFSLELIDIVEYLHKCKIIHADLKPDNIVLRELPSNDEIEPCLQLIDFGRCIDMSLLPPDTKFNIVFKVEDNKCIEMKENKPWSYQIDLQGLASILHVLLFSEYMKIHKKNNIWQLQKIVPRNVKREIWNPIFESLLNVNPAKDLPFNFSPMRESLLEVLNSPQSSSLNQQLKHFANYISGK